MDAKETKETSTKPMSSRKVVLALALLVCGSAAAWVFASFRQTPTLELTEADKARHARLWEAVQKMAERGKRGELPWRYTDFKSVGNVEEEGQLLRLFDQLTLYQDSRGELPRSLADLIREGNVDRESRKECLVVLPGRQRAILNCDGWTPPQGEEVERLIRGFTPRTVKFYVSDGHIMLYVPPTEKVGKPATR